MSALPKGGLHTAVAEGQLRATSKHPRASKEKKKGPATAAFHLASHARSAMAPAIVPGPKARSGGRRGKAARPALLINASHLSMFLKLGCARALQILAMQRKNLEGVGTATFLPLLPCRGARRIDVINLQDCCSVCPGFVVA
jgi:hypothetical protein